MLFIRIGFVRFKNMIYQNYFNLFLNYTRTMFGKSVLSPSLMNKYQSLLLHRLGKLKQFSRHRNTNPTAQNKSDPNLYSKTLKLFRSRDFYIKNLTSIVYSFRFNFYQHYQWDTNVDFYIACNVIHKLIQFEKYLSQSILDKETSCHLG